MPILFAACLYFSLAFMTWLFFLAIMSLKHARDAGKLTKTASNLAWPILIIGYPLDFLFNIASSFIFLEFPQEWLFTARVSRHIKGNGWRAALAHWICSNLLNPFDEGHCGK